MQNVKQTTQNKTKQQHRQETRPDDVQTVGQDRLTGQLDEHDQIE